MVFTGQRFRAFCLGLFFSLAVLTTAYGDTPTLFFQHIDETKGLPDNTVFQIMQDHKGAMWFGTRNGVARYDGMSMKVFQNEAGNPHSLSHNDAGGVLEDSDGMIWVRTWGGGFNQLDPVSGRTRVFRHDPSDPRSISEDRVQTHYADSLGVIWAGTFSKGLNRFERETETFTRYMADGQPGSISHNRIWSFAETGRHTLWVGTESGLNRFNRREGTFKGFRNSPADPTSLPHDQIRALYPASDSTLWVGTSKGLRLFDMETEQCISFPGMGQQPLRDATINALYDDGKTLWVGTSKYGLLILNKKTGNSCIHSSVPYLAHSLSHNDIRWITEDRSGVIWLGTRGGGVSTLSKIFHQMRLYMPGYSGDDIPMSVHATAADGAGNLWLGSWYTGLRQMTPESRAGKSTADGPLPLGLDNQDINALALDPEENLWIGTWGAGLMVRDHETGQFRRWKDEGAKPDERVITALSVKKPGVVWAGTRSQGLYRHDLATGEVRRFIEGPEKKEGLSSNTIHALLEDHRNENTLWVGTNLGLNRIDVAENQVTQYHHRKETAESLSNNVITCLAQTPNGSIWVGTYNGLNRLNPLTETIRTYFMKDGLSGNIIKSLVFDGNRRLWVATEKGLSTIDIKDGSISRLPLPLRFLQGAASLTSDGRVFFGGENGYLLSTPKEIPLTRPTASLRLTELQLNGTPVVPGKPFEKRPILSRPLNETQRIELNHTENNLTFGFVLHDYNNTAENRYRYKLDGYDAAWVDAGSTPFARYSHLPPGTYRFQVMAAGSQGAWNQSHPGIEIHISPPVWNRWYVQAALFLLIVGLIHLRFTTIRKRNRELEEIVSRRTQELKEQSRLHERLALTDTLTELLNRRGVQKREKELHAIARRTRRPYNLIMADIDNFKQINDTYGHDCGDFVLQRVSRLMESNLRAYDILGRWGGEEFILLLPETDGSGAKTLAERLRDRIATSLFEWDGTYLTVTLTLGVVACTPEETFEQTIAKADAALYNGKKSGKNRVVVA